MRILIFVTLCIAASRSALIQKRAAAACYYNGQSYTQGQKWTVPCQYNCQCKDATRGLYQCTEMCPTYPNLPRQCRLVTKQGECCKKPECDFTTSGGQISGSGTSCRDSIQNCADYGRGVCTNQAYDGWVRENCGSYCNKCPTTGGTGGGSVTGGGGVSSSCVDRLDNCVRYGRDVCSKPEYHGWVNDNCKAYCNRCSGSGSGGGTGTITGGGTGTITGGGTGTGTGSGTITGGGTGTGGGTITGGGTGGVSGGGSGACVDKDPGCSHYVAAMCTDATYRPFAMANCRRHCNWCGTGSGTSTGTGGGTGNCRDNVNNCAELNRANNLCTDSGARYYAQINCARTCNMCSTSGGAPTGTGTGTGGGTGGTGGSSGTGSHTSTGGISGQTGTISGTSSGCVYKGQVYSQGQEFRDGCNYKCTCEDASQGRYKCRSMCVTWRLPKECSLNPPAAGKCCQTPSCPSGYIINYPPGYVEE